MEDHPEPIKEILEELFSLLESLETQSLALTQFLKDQGIATDEKLGPYLDRAGNASSVKWRAARARMQYLLSPVPKQSSDKEDKEKEKSKELERPSAERPQTEKSATEKPANEKPATEKPGPEKPRAEQNKPVSSDAAKDTARNTGAGAEKNAKPVAQEDAKKFDTQQKSKTG
jgi:hypothetical protein